MMTFTQINILLLASYMLFRFVRKMEDLLWRTSSSFISLRSAQILVTISILTPFAFKAIPVKREVINPPVFEITGEERITAVKETKRKINSLITSTPSTYKKLEEKMSFSSVMLVKICLCLGMLILLGRFASHYIKLQSLLSNSFLLRDGKKIKVAISEVVSIPFSVRMGRTFWVVMPMDLLARKMDFTLALKHEFQHHRQKDTTWAVLIEILSCIFYFNPAIYLWKNTIIELQEFSCDEALTGQSDVLSHDYGSCLLRVAETALEKRQMYAGTTSMAVVFRNSKYFKTFLLRRIEMIVREKRGHNTWLPVCTGLVIALCTVTFAYGVEKVIRSKAAQPNFGKLIVDEKIQKIASDSLEKALKDPQFSAGFVIVSNPNTGKILAVANIDKKNRLKNHWALSQLVEPASLGKTFIIAEAIDKNLATPETHFKCENGKYNYKGRTYYDWRAEGFDELTTTETLAISSNICSMKIAERVGEVGLKEMTEKFGFGTNGTAKDFPEAKVGDKVELTEDFIPRISFGYAFRNSPLEIMQAFGAVVNGGRLMKPIMGDESSEVIRRVISEESSQKMKEILKEVVLSGTAKETALSSFYTTAGKTASSSLGYFGNEKFKGNERPNFASFIGFAPVKNPQIQVYVGMLKEEAKKSGAHGGAHAGPIFKEVTENILASMKVAPDKI